MKVLNRAVVILNVLSDKGIPMGITEISEETVLPKATTHRILGALQENYLVLQDRHQKYSLGPAFLRWAYSYNRSSGLIDIARPFLQELSEKISETIHLVIYENRKAYYIFKIESSHPVGMLSRTGTELPLYSTGVGRAILSVLPREDLDEYLEKTDLLKRTPDTLIDRERLREILKEFRDKGYSEENQQNEVGIRCVGAAIMDSNNFPTGAISISIPAYRFQDEKVDEYGMLAKKTAELISRTFGWSNQD